MKENNLLLTIAVVGAIVLGLIWVKKDHQASVPGVVVPGQSQQPQQSPGQQQQGWPVSLKQAKESGKQLFVYFGRTDCAPCQRMKNEVLPSPGVQQALSKYIVCVFDATQESALATKFGVNMVPTMLVVDGNEQVVKKTTGYMAADQFTNWLAGSATPSSQDSPPGNSRPSQPQPQRKNNPRMPPGGRPGQRPVGPGCGPG